MNTRQTSRALTAVSVLFLASGAWTVVVAAWSLIGGYGVTSSLSIADLWLGLGLLARRRWALTWAPVSLSLSVAGGVLVLALSLMAGRASHAWVIFAGHVIGPVPRVVYAGAALGLVTLSLWQMGVFARAETRSLFSVPDREHATTGNTTFPGMVWRLALDPRVLLGLTLVFTFAIGIASDRMSNTRFQRSMVACLDDFSRARSQADTARIDDRVVPLKGAEVVIDSQGLTCRFFRHPQ